MFGGAAERKKVEKQFLTEENYQKGNRVFKTISLVILIVALVVGGGLIALGAVKQNEAGKINEERAAAAEAEAEQNVAAARARVAEIDQEVAELQTQHDAKEDECNSLDMMADGWYTQRVACQREVSELWSQISHLEMEKFELENKDYGVLYKTVGMEYYVVFYFVGGTVLLFGCVISLSMYLVTKRRALAAYHAQTHLPIIKEGVADVTPTVAQSAGTVAGSVAEGIAQGVKKERY